MGSTEQCQKLVTKTTGLIAMKYPYAIKRLEKVSGDNDRDILLL